MRHRLLPAALVAALWTTAARGDQKPPAYPPLPQAVSSFGADVCGGYLYTFGGHRGRTHSYSTDTAVGALRRLKLDGGTAWEELPGGPAAQGLALVAHGGKLIRLGGMQPRNKPGDDADNHSLTTVARFDPAAGTWAPLPALPEGRSSHDAVVAGERLVVVGGWNMGGRGTEPAWHNTALLLDLARSGAKWESVPQPFRRRALAAAALGGKVYVIAGIGEGGITSAVNVLDVAKREWSAGPDLPGGSGFAPAACVLDGRLHVSTSDGKLHRLSVQGDAWEEAGTLRTARMVHRLVAANGRLIAVGGAAKGGNVAELEVVTPLR